MLKIICAGNKFLNTTCMCVTGVIHNICILKILQTSTLHVHTTHTTYVESEMWSWKHLGGEGQIAMKDVLAQMDAAQLEHADIHAGLRR